MIPPSNFLEHCKFEKSIGMTAKELGNLCNAYVLISGDGDQLPLTQDTRLIMFYANDPCISSQKVEENNQIVSLDNTHPQELTNATWYSPNVSLFDKPKHRCYTLGGDIIAVLDCYLNLTFCDLHNYGYPIYNLVSFIVKDAYNIDIGSAYASNKIDEVINRVGKIEKIVSIEKINKEEAVKSMGELLENDKSRMKLIDNKVITALQKTLEKERLQNKVLIHSARLEGIRTSMNIIASIDFTKWKIEGTRLFYLNPIFAHVIVKKNDHVKVGNNVFYVKGLNFDIGENVSIVKCDKAFHPNVDNTTVCMGDLIGADLPRVIDEIPSALSLACLDSAYENKATEMANEIFTSELKHEESEFKHKGAVWHVDRSPGRYDEEGYDEYGYDSGGYDEYGYDEDGFNSDGYDEDGFNSDGHDRDGYNREGYDEDGYNENGYNRAGYDRDGYNSDGYDEYGYNRDGYDSDGYDEHGYDVYGYDRDGYNREGYYEDGYNKNGYNRAGYDSDGYDSDGYDEYGYNRDGYDSDGNPRAI
jgi:polyhydroxyalkanoate synthesis regulator phasin